MYYVSIQQSQSVIIILNRVQVQIINTLTYGISSLETKNPNRYAQGNFFRFSTPN